MRFAQGQNLAMTGAGIAETGDVGALGRLLPKVILIHIVTVQTVRIAEVMGDIYRALINVYVGACGAEEDWHAADCSVGCGDKSEQSFCDRIGAGLYLSSIRVGKDVARGGQPLAMRQAFIAREKKGVVFPDGSADIAPKLVTFQS